MAVGLLSKLFYVLGMVNSMEWSLMKKPNTSRNSGYSTVCRTSALVTWGSHTGPNETLSLYPTDLNAPEVKLKATCRSRARRLAICGYSDDQVLWPVQSLRWTGILGARAFERRISEGSPSPMEVQA